MKKSGHLNPAAPSNRAIALERRFGPIEYRSIESLSTYSNNPRKHPEHQRVKLTASITEFGFAIPILVDDSFSQFVRFQLLNWKWLLTEWTEKGRRRANSRDRERPWSAGETTLGECECRFTYQPRERKTGEHC